MGKIGVFVRSPYNYDVDEASDASGLYCDPDEGLAEQSFRDECDINEIVRRFGLTGELPQNVAMPISGDFTAATDFQSAMNVVRQAQEAFMEFPADVRRRFADDPATMIAFLEDEANRAEAEKLGLVVKRAAPERSVVQAVDELAAKMNVTGDVAKK